MKQTQKFTQFTDLRSTVAVPAKRPKTHFTADEVENIRIEARAEGLASAEAEAADRIATTFEVMLTQIEKLFAQTHEFETRHRKEAVELAWMTGKALADAALARFPEAEIEAALTEAVATMPSETALSLQINPAIEDHFSKACQKSSIWPRLKNNISIYTDDDISESDCRIEWEGGGLLLTINDRSRKVTELIKSHFGSLTETTPSAEDPQNEQITAQGVSNE